MDGWREASRRARGGPPAPLAHAPARLSPPSPSQVPHPKGSLRGFDAFVNMVLDDVEETGPDGVPSPGRIPSLLLNGNNIAVLVPGGKPSG